MTPIEFAEFPKIPRLFRNCVITEKLDGTNASIIITDDGEIAAASRTRLITPGKVTDNYGFAAWVHANKEALIEELGPGRHFGEWWGNGIQRGYDLKEKRFSLFNTARWMNKEGGLCGVVPVLYVGLFDTEIVSDVVWLLSRKGSTAAPGFMKPEGVVIWHDAAGHYFKVTCEKDEAPKGAVH